MTVEKFITVEVSDSDAAIIRENTYSEEEVNRIGGVGGIIEAIEPLLREGEHIEIHRYYQE
jgi:Mg2+/Co2+ transporter CorC